MKTNLNIVPFVSVDNMMKLILRIGVERFLVELAGFIEEDFARWESFDRAPRLASHWPALAVSLLVSTTATIAVTGWLGERLARRGDERGEARP